MTATAGFTISKTLEAPFEAALERLTAAITAEGFGILYTLDFSEIIAAKTGERLPGRVVGLGVCDPRLAARALRADPRVAALLPCGAFAAETPAGVQVGVLDPLVALSVAANPTLEPLGREARERLARAVSKA